MFLFRYVSLLAFVNVLLPDLVQPDSIADYVNATFVSGFRTCVGKQVRTSCGNDLGLNPSPIFVNYNYAIVC